MEKFFAGFNSNLFIKLSIHKGLEHTRVSYTLYIADEAAGEYTIVQQPLPEVSVWLKFKAEELKVLLKHLLVLLAVII